MKVKLNSYSKQLYLVFSISTCFFLFLGKWLSWQEAYLLFMGLWLSYYDVQTQEYPVIIWMGMTAGLLPFHNIHHTFIILFLTAILASIKNIGIGAGDFLYLSSLSLVVDFENIIWIIQWSSLIGIGYYFLKLNQKRSIAFIPFIVCGYVIVLFI